MDARVPGLGDGMLTVTDAALRGVINGYTREAGVRQLNRELVKLCRALTLEMEQLPSAPPPPAPPPPPVPTEPQAFKDEALAKQALPQAAAEALAAPAPAEQKSRSSVESCDVAPCVSGMPSVSL